MRRYPLYLLAAAAAFVPSVAWTNWLAVPNMAPALGHHGGFSFPPGSNAPDNPVFSADFSAGASTGISVSRSTQETCEATNSVVSYAAANQPCLTTEGVQSYSAGSNLVPQSASATGWTKNNTTLVAGSAGTAPDGTNAALVMTDTSTSGTHYVLAGNESVTSGQTYTSSFYAKMGTCAQASFECRFIGVTPVSSVSQAVVDVDLQTCQIVGGTSYTLQSAAIPLANGWCHVYYTWTSVFTGSAGAFQLYMQPGTPSGGTAPATYAGAGSTVLLWGVQNELTTRFLPYCPTAGASATCNADVITSTGSLKTALEAASLRVVAKIGRYFNFNGGGIVGVGTGLNGLGVSTGNQATTNWPTASTLKTAGQLLRGTSPNWIGLSASAAGRSLALNGQAAVADLNALSASSQEYIGSLSTGANCDCAISSLQVWGTRDDAQMLAATVNPLSLPLVASYTGPVATHITTPQGVLAAASATQAMTRSHHVATENISSLRIRFPNYQVPNQTTESEAGPGAATTITASIEYPAGSCTAMTFSASASGSIPDNSSLLSDSLSINIPAGAEFWVRNYRTNASGIVYNSSLAFIKPDAFTGEAMTYGTSGVADSTSSCGAVTATNTSFWYTPDAIVGPTQRKSYCIIGDSRSVGGNDSYSDKFEYMGEVGRWVGPYHPTLNINASGDTAQYFSQFSTNRKQLLTYCTGMIVELGVNDIYGYSETPTQAEAYLQTVYGFSSLLHGGSGPVWQTTIQGKSSSTDSWATTTNQTVISGGTNMAAVSDWVRANTAGITGFFEVADALSTARNSNIWNANGLAFGVTKDGLHEVQYGNFLIANSLGRPALGGSAIGSTNGQFDFSNPTNSGLLFSF